MDDETDKTYYEKMHAERIAESARVREILQILINQKGCRRPSNLARWNIEYGWSTFEGSTKLPVKLLSGTRKNFKRKRLRFDKKAPSTQETNDKQENLERRG